ncbi:RNA polymerase sigma factor [Nannocystis bainbridge]|uniref:Sigma-70 family RNA polymerase sigma factor n=1 Tax=Nannocystis bainbridge TaxID=2995303 RepID=A0ABT5E6W3_9BACT|nr:sigma-70 family RNA polymerase sigma factor [Nannocystis bainbridge]MDC0721604.1 sigma-70 family RNA polymerase sigma factor [Nannocystis bainbridge]
MDDPDRRLLDAWRAGDRQAGQALASQHYPAVYRFFFGKVRDSVCEDLAQQTFEVVCRRRDAYRGDGSFRAYLFGVARFVLIGWARRQRRFEPTEDSLPADAEPLPGLLADRELVRLVATALRSLPLDDQLIIELKDWEHLTQAELAALFEAPQATVARRLQRARARLRVAVEQLVDDPALRDRTLRGLESCMESIRVEVERRFGPEPRGRDPE